jgi:hypothetical protein
MTAEFRNCEAMLCAFRNFITDRTSQSVGAVEDGGSYSSYCENAGSTVSACAMLQHCSITYAQSLRAI